MTTVWHLANVPFNMVSLQACTLYSKVVAQIWLFTCTYEKRQELAYD